MARFDFGSFMSEARPGSIRIAFVGAEEAVWPDRFLQAVAVNRGVLVRVTIDEEEATEWLKDDSPPAGE